MGDSGVGKTSIFNTYINGLYTSENNATNGL